MAVKSRVRKKARPRRQTKKFRRFERQIDRFTLQMLKELQALVVKKLVPRIRLLAETQKDQDKVKKASPSIRFDQSEGQSLDELIDLIEAQFLGRFSRSFIAQNLNTIFGDLDSEAFLTTESEFKRESMALIPSVNTKTVIENAVRTSLGKIENLTQNTIGEIRSIVAQGVVSGSRWETIAKDLTKSMTSPSDDPSTFKKAVNRAKFIARNEVSSTLGAVNKERQLSSGVELYRWQTAEDERVRPTHRALNDRIFAWQGTVEDGGETYTMAVDKTYSSSGTIPGQPWNCRCVAIPHFSEDEDLGFIPAEEDL